MGRVAESEQVAEMDGRPAPPTAAGRRSEPLRNLLTVDVEDYFHASGLEEGRPRINWRELPGRVEYTTRRLLGILSEAGCRATFFVLGWVAARHPGLVREIHEGGHEVASHGWGHRMVTRDGPAEFRADVERSRKFLEDIVGAPVYGYRAPSFTITPRTAWALRVLEDVGFRYDSSVFPIRRHRYGDPGSPRGIHWILPPGMEGRGLLEVPLTTVRILGRNVPVAGGGYLRAFPLWFTRWAIRRINDADDIPAVVYLHPWEIDPDQPRLPASPGNRFRHYLNLHRTESRLRQLLEEFRFEAVVDALETTPGFRRVWEDRPWASRADQAAAS